MPRAGLNRLRKTASESSIATAAPVEDARDVAPPLDSNREGEVAHAPAPQRSPTTHRPTTSALGRSRPAGGRNDIIWFHVIDGATLDDTLQHLRAQRQRKRSAATAGTPTLLEPAALASTAKSAGGSGPAHVASCTCAICREDARRLRAVDGDGDGATLYYAMNSSIPLIHAMFRAHGFRLTKAQHWNVLWTSHHLKAHLFKVRPAGERRSDSRPCVRVGFLYLLLCVG